MTRTLLTLTVLGAAFLFFAEQCRNHPSQLSDASYLWGFAVDAHPVTNDFLCTIVKETGLPPHIVLFFLQWQKPIVIKNQT